MSAWTSPRPRSNSTSKTLTTSWTTTLKVTLPWLKKVGALQDTQIICEATGGYEKGIVSTLHAAAQPVSVLNPAALGG